MVKEKTRVFVFFGGRSPEHDVSIISGLQALSALDPTRYEAHPVYIAPDGQWLTGDLLRDRNSYIPGPATLKELTPVHLKLGPSKPALVTEPRGAFGRPKVMEFDVAIPAFHGLIGEDGGIQGLFEVANVPYTGMRPLASTVMMDKIATKRMIASTDVPQLKFWEIKRPARGLLLTPDELKASLGDLPFPMIIKPAHLGSSIGVARVTSFEEISDTLAKSIFRFDDTAMLEPFVENLVEYNVAVRRSGGEIVTSAIERPKMSTELLDFKTKYMSGGSNKSGNKTGGTKSAGTSSQGMLSLTRDINPQIAPEFEANIRKWAATVYAQVGGSGSPRLDFLCNGKTGEAWFNEANPCPGSFGYFLWEAAKKPTLFSDLLDDLIAEAQMLHARSQIPADPTPEDARLFKRQK